MVIYLKLQQTSQNDCDNSYFQFWIAATPNNPMLNPQ